MSAGTSATTTETTAFIPRPLPEDVRALIEAARLYVAKVDDKTEPFGAVDHAWRQFRAALDRIEAS